jgi:hypothetical protein
MFARMARACTAQAAAGETIAPASTVTAAVRRLHLLFAQSKAACVLLLLLLTMHACVCRHDDPASAALRPAFAATLGQMLDDFFQYATELQQSLEQQGGRCCSSRVGSTARLTSACACTGAGMPDTSQQYAGAVSMQLQVLPHIHAVVCSCTSLAKAGTTNHTQCSAGLLS